MGVFYDWIDLADGKKKKGFKPCSRKRFPSWLNIMDSTEMDRNGPSELVQSQWVRRCPGSNRADVSYPAPLTIYCFSFLNICQGPPEGFRLLVSTISQCESQDVQGSTPQKVLSCHLKSTDFFPCFSHQARQSWKCWGFSHSVQLPGLWRALSLQCCSTATDLGQMAGCKSSHLQISWLYLVIKT